MVIGVGVVGMDETSKMSEIHSRGADISNEQIMDSSLPQLDLCSCLAITLPLIHVRHANGQPLSIHSDNVR